MPPVDDASPPAPNADLEVGARVSYKHARGTVRYVGALGAGAGAGGDAKKAPAGTWLGVEWDDRRRGKHWGEHAGVSYFQCVYHARRRRSASVEQATGQGQEQEPAAPPAKAQNHKHDSTGPASFLRPTASGLVRGTSVLHALRERYAPAPASASGSGSGSADAVPSAPAPGSGGEGAAAAAAAARYTRRDLSSIAIEAPGLAALGARIARLERLRAAALEGRAPRRRRRRAGAHTGAGKGAEGGESSSAEDDDGDGEETDEAVAETQAETETDEAERMLVRCALDAARGEARGDLGRTCPKLTALDLADNLLATWQAVAGIWAELPALASLRLAGNRLARLPSPSSSSAGAPPLPQLLAGLPAAPALRELNLDRTRVPFGDAARVVAACLPALQALSFAGNRAERLRGGARDGEHEDGDGDGDANRDADGGAAPHQQTQLTTLNLAGNRLSDFAGDVQPAIARFFPRVERLNLSANRLRRIDPPPALSGQQAQAAQAPVPVSRQRALPLKHFNVADNPGLERWADLEALDAWAALAQAQASEEGGADGQTGLAHPRGLSSLVLDLSGSGGGGLYHSGRDAGGSARGGERADADDGVPAIVAAASWRALSGGDAVLALLARLPALDTVNGSALRADQRRDAEIHVAGKYAAASAAASKDAPADANTHARLAPFPRYAELAEKYKDALPAAGSAPPRAAATLKSRLLDLRVCFVSAPPGTSASAGAAATRVLHAAPLRVLPSTPLRMARAKVARTAPSGLRAAAAQRLELWALIGVAEEGEGADVDVEGENDDAQLARLLAHRPLLPLEPADDHRALEHFGLGPRDWILAHIPE